MGKSPDSSLFFSKVYRLTGHRVGMLIASKKLIKEIEKFLDTTSICPNRLGQKAALFGLKNLESFIDQEKNKIEQIKTIFKKGIKKFWLDNFRDRRIFCLFRLSIKNELY